MFESSFSRFFSGATCGFSPSPLLGLYLQPPMDRFLSSRFIDFLPFVPAEESPRFLLSRVPANGSKLLEGLPSHPFAYIRTVYASPEMLHRGWA